MTTRRVTQSFLIVFLTLVVHISALPVGADTLYGIVYEGANAGYLITIDMGTGQAELVGDTGLDRPCVLTFDYSKDMLLTSNCFGYPPQGFAVDQQTGAASLVMEHLSPNNELAYHRTIDVLYGVDPGFNDSVLVKLDPDSGDWVTSDGIIGKGPVTALAVEPGSDALYGVGLRDGHPWFFRIPILQGSADLPETDVAQIDRILTGLAFGSQGRLYGTDGDRLYQVNTSNGALDEIGEHGDDIGSVQDIVLVSERVVLLPGQLRSWRKEYIPIEYIIDIFERLEICPPWDPKCPFPGLSIDSQAADVPWHASTMSEALGAIARSVRSGRPYEEALRSLQTTLPDIPEGVYFNETLRSELTQFVEYHLAQAERPPAHEFLASDVLMRAMNAIELDWRTPAAGVTNVPIGRYVGVDLGGVVWAGFRDVVGSGVMTLEVTDRYAAFPVNRAYTPTWPYLSYAIDFDAQLGGTGFVDLTFYIKPLRFHTQASTIAVLRVTDGGLVDVTVGQDRPRGFVTARTDRPGTFIVLGKH